MCLSGKGSVYILETFKNKHFFQYFQSNKKFNFKTCIILIDLFLLFSEMNFKMLIFSIHSIFHFNKNALNNMPKNLTFQVTVYL